MSAGGLSLNTKWLGHDLRREDTVNSTNDFLKNLARQGAECGTVIFAEEQTGGKGRMGRSWIMPKSSSIAMSCLLRPKFKPEKASMLTLLMGLSVAQACMRLYPLKIWIKWPNDIIVSGKKICGILTEMDAEPGRIHWVVVGVGINCNFTDFPEDLREKAVSLQQALGHPVDRELLAAAVLEDFEKNYEKFCLTEDLSGLQEAYNALLINRGRQVKVLQPKKELRGVAQGINAQGELLVEKEDRTLAKIRAGEVSVRGLDGYV